MNHPVTPPRGSSAEALLLALVSSSCPMIRVDFRPEELARLMGWWREAIAHRFQRLQDDGWVTAVAGAPDRYQIHPRALPWVWANAVREIPSAIPDTVQEAAQSLVILRMHRCRR